ncbi:YhgE/Pip domain-containing protein [Paenibacillus physcomitrellae]|uniref:Phage infection protein n=1 Tax=Paenibacillus physcomitrellae TaxID=1619311 RepID=A0ABQ1GB24_9BACL|nr:YhgE/Pip domain-containing protein [Paenibacillus physcomitrellae]GGA40175.1 phage infection protein [Paenibacillus physcomitrellae]
MHGFRLIFQDWKHLIHHKHGRIAMIFLILVPLIYVGLFLSGYWNPYGRLDHLPVAVVNLDKGAVLNGKPVEVGHNFVDELAQTNELDFDFVTAEAASEGMKKGDYYMIVTIPEDFSSHAATLMDEHPEQAELIYQTNAGRNFVASQIGTSAIKEMKAKLQAELTKAYTDGVFSSMQKLADGLNTAGSGAEQLHKGTETAKKGFSELASGISNAAVGASDLQKGSGKLSTSSSELAKGTNQLNQGAEQLAAGLQQLTLGQSKLEAASGKLSDKLGKWQASSRKNAEDWQAAEGASKQLTAALESYIKEHPSAAEDPDLQALLKQAETTAELYEGLSQSETALAANADEIAQGQQQLNKQTSLFAAKLKENSQGAKSLSSSAEQLDSGMANWTKGMASLNQGITALADGSRRLTTGTGQLYQGLDQLNNGSGELASKLALAKSQTTGLHASPELENMFVEPVKLTESKGVEVPNYGAGIAPYFISLGLFVGGIMGANILPLGRRQGSKLASGHQFINKLGLFLTVGIVQTIILDALILFAFQIQVQHFSLFVCFSLVTSFTFLSIIYMLLSIFGFVGKFLAVTLLVTQLATCGGTFPGQLMAPAMAAIGRLLPMTYSVQGFQQAISVGDYRQWTAALWIMLAYLIGSALIGLLFNRLEQRKNQIIENNSAQTAA